MLFRPIRGFWLSRYIAGLIGRMVGDWIYFPGRHFSRPQPAYGPALTMRSQNKPHEALEYLQELTKNHPGLARPYVEMMDIADQELKDQEMVREIYQMALPKLKKQEKKLLEEAYQEMYQN